jgi:5-methylcytosine-specific restriction enzyme subunit McrC
MSSLPSRPLADPAQSTVPDGGIPIRNIWHMLFYAWNELPVKNGWMLGDAEVAPTLDALLASMLIKLMQGRLRIGLGGDYVSGSGTLQGIRGRINFTDSLKRRTFEHGEAQCEYEHYSLNAPKNQIIRTTLARLVQQGQFGADIDQANALRHRLRWLVKNLDGIDLIELTPNLIHRQQLNRNDRDYRVMLEICFLVLQGQMPTELPGQYSMPSLARDTLIVHRIYERFIANFYRLNLNGWTVSPQKRLEWHEKSSSPHLPAMIPDLVLQEKSSRQLIVLDTKFTPHSLVQNQWGKKIYDSSHLYQLYAYLRSQEHVSEAHRGAVGILLYPAILEKCSERIELQDHLMRVECIDLTMPWQDIERQLLELIRNAGT